MSDDLGIKIGGDSSGAEAALARVSTAAEREMRRTAQQTEFARIAATEYEKALKKASATAAAANSDTGGGGSDGPNSRFTRELIVLGHELSQGNYKRFGGSLLVLAEYSQTASGALHALVGPVGAVLAGVAALGVAFLKGAHEEQAFNNALTLTGNYAGITAGKLEGMVKSVAAATNGTVGSAREVLQGIVASGQFGPALIDSTAQAVVRLERLTGEDASKIVGDFAKMGDGVAKWAAEHNRSMHFLSAAQYEYIKTLEDQGQAERAEQVTLDALNDRLKASDKQLGYVAQAWQWAKAKASEYFDQVAGLGRSSSIDSEIERVQKRIAALKSSTDLSDLGQGYLVGIFKGSTPEKDLAEMEALITRLKESKKLNDDVAAATARSQKIQADAIAASDVVKRISEENDKRSKSVKLVEEYTAAVRKMREANDPKAPSVAQEAATIKLIQERNRNPGDKQGEEFLKNLQRQLESATKGKEEMLRLEAAQKGVARAAQPYIDRLEEIELRGLRIKRIVAETAEEELQRGKVTSFITASNDHVKSLIDETDAIGLTANETKRLTELRKFDNEVNKAMAGANSDTREEIMRLSTVLRTNLVNALDEAIRKRDEFATGAQHAVKQYIEDASNQAAFSEGLVGGAMKRAEDAVVKFAKTGKVSLGDLFSFMADEFIRQQARMLISTAAQGYQSGGIWGALGAIGSIFTGGGNGAGVDSTGGADFGAGGMIGGGRAGGGPVRAGTTYMVGERGPELFKAPSSGTIVPNHELGADARTPTVVIQPTYHFGHNVSPQDVAAAVQLGNLQLKSEIIRSVKFGGWAAA